MEDIENGQVVGSSREWDEMHPEEEGPTDVEEKTMIRCPLCGDDDFDTCGLEIHFSSKLCPEYNRLLVVEQDALVMALRLLDETESMSPDTWEVVDRWRPRCEKLLRGE